MPLLCLRLERMRIIYLLRYDIVTQCSSGQWRGIRKETSGNLFFFEGTSKKCWHEKYGRTKTHNSQWFLVFTFYYFHLNVECKIIHPIPKCYYEYFIEWECNATLKIKIPRSHVHFCPLYFIREERWIQNLENRLVTFVTVSDMLFQYTPNLFIIFSSLSFFVHLKEYFNCSW